MTEPTEKEREILESFEHFENWDVHGSAFFRIRSGSRVVVRKHDGTWCIEGNHIHHANWVWDIKTLAEVRMHLRALSLLEGRLRLLRID